MATEDTFCLLGHNNNILTVYMVLSFIFSDNSKTGFTLPLANRNTKTLSGHIHSAGSLTKYTTEPCLNPRLACVPNPFFHVTPCGPSLPLKVRSHRHLTHCQRFREVAPSLELPPAGWHSRTWDCPCTVPSTQWGVFIVMFLETGGEDRPSDSLKASVSGFVQRGKNNQRG